MKTVQTKISLAEQAFNILKEEIATGRLQVGDPLPEEKISAQLGISRTPFRDALHKLENEGLVIAGAGKPATVAGFSREDSLAHIDMRRVLETENLERIIDKLDDRMMMKLKDNLKRQQEAVDQGNHQHYLELDRAFHILLTEVNPNHLFHQMIQKLCTGVSRAFLTLSNTIGTSLESSFAEHQEILDALEARDLNSAKEAMTRHLDNVEARFLKFYDNRRDPDDDNFT
ncbi:GntR family transcriptional regulator [Salinicoccus kekensis]|uniref:GntR family transcriptional regulator n=1 Tax=Salinicoccus kekensis TaxID=714307 RepID=A0A285UP71_9STAP|nr:GntR family transcriptional regulator [Salinicoccus kekensis]SOC43622.1 GntR family transcriptional regulator [Salinicoccus kekensis]